MNLARSTLVFLHAFALMVFILSPGARGVELPVNELLVTVENGTEPYVVLDCPYTLTEEDKRSLVLKWYLNNSEIQAYQWIPDGKIVTPQTTIPEDILDATYEHSDDPYHRYRALKLLSPTIRLSGDYTCVVSSYENEDTLRITLIVYVLPEEMTLAVEELPDGNVSITCISHPTYPEPYVGLYVEVDGEREAIQADRETVYDDNTYNTTLSTELPPEKLALYGNINIVCRMTIPNSNISLEESLHLGPEVEEEEEEEDDDDEPVVIAGASTHREVAVTGSGAASKTNALLPLLVVLIAWGLRSSSGRAL